MIRSFWKLTRQFNDLLVNQPVVERTLVFEATPGAGEIDVFTFGVVQTPDKLFPVIHILNLIEKQMTIGKWNIRIMLAAALRNKNQFTCIPAQPFIFKIDKNDFLDFGTIFKNGFGCLRQSECFATSARPYGRIM